jgi:hypothetical protein
MTAVIVQLRHSCVCVCVCVRSCCDHLCGCDGWWVDSPNPVYCLDIFFLYHVCMRVFE